MRSITPLALILLVMLWPTDGGISPARLAVAAVLVVVGELLRLRAVGVAGKRTRTRGHRVDELVTAGPFAHVRNPLYIGNFVLSYGLVVLSKIGWLLWVFPALFLLQYSAIVSWEESVLEATFGERYARYKRRVRRWIPSIAAYDEPSSHRFSHRTAWQSERNSLQAVGIVFVLILVKHALLYEYLQVWIDALAGVFGTQ